MKQFATLSDTPLFLVSFEKPSTSAQCFCTHELIDISELSVDKHSLNSIQSFLFLNFIRVNLAIEWRIFLIFLDNTLMKMRTVFYFRNSFGNWNESIDYFFVKHRMPMKYHMSVFTIMMIMMMPISSFICMRFVLKKKPSNIARRCYCFNFYFFFPFLISISLHKYYMIGRVVSHKCWLDVRSTYLHMVLYACVWSPSFLCVYLWKILIVEF